MRPNQNTGQVSDWGHNVVVDRATSASQDQILSVDPSAPSRLSYSYRLRTGSQFVSPIAGRYIPPINLTLASTSISNNVFYLHYYPVAQPLTVDRMALRVATLESGVTAKLGLYSFDGTNFNLDLSVGTIDCSTTGNKEITISPAFTIREGVWIGFLPQGSAGTVRFLSTTSGVFPIGSSTLVGATQEVRFNFNLTGQTGDLPTSTALSGLNEGLGGIFYYGFRVGSLL